MSPPASESAAPSPRVAVVGGGISGLAAAHRLVELDPKVSLTLYERAARLGGVLSTIHEGGFQVEQSADNFITTVPWGTDLCRRIGLSDELIGTNPAHRQTFVVRRGRMYKLPDGFLMMAPTRMWPLAVTPILSPLGKLRAGLEFFIPPRRDEGDESMAAFVRRRLGREVFERLVEPLVSAVYAADMEKLSVQATLPQFREMELEHGSLIRAMRRRMASMPRGRTGDTGARYSMFVTPRHGLSSLIDALAARLPAGAVRLNTAVWRIARGDDGRWTVWSGNADAPAAESFDAVILATPSHVAARLLEPVEPALARDLASIEHSGTAIVSVGYARRQVVHPLDGMGVVVPAIENSPMLACSFSSQKYAHRAPEGHVLLRVFAGGARRPDLAVMDDDQLRPLILAELDRLVGIRGDPVYASIARWPGTMPQYHVGHRCLVARIEAAAARLGHFALAGNAFHGVGIPHCIHSGEQAAEHVLRARSVVGA
ncbi:MAG: protoporphyrinogen oxidase [Thermoguttaceae bacterium]|nr:protoporphyrinogen oxidase [Thermoguttaceae bacterium]